MHDFEINELLRFETQIQYGFQIEIADSLHFQIEFDNEL